MLQSNSPHAIVILYDGRDMSEEEYALFSATVVDLLSRAGIAIPELTTMVYKDTEELTKLFLKETADAKKADSVRDKKEDPVENALKYLSTRYGAFFVDTDTLGLAFQLSKDIQNKKDIALTNALKIVCEEETVHITQLKKYKISRDALNTIQRWYCMTVHSN